MYRFFTHQNDINSNEISITDKNEIHHMKNVLQLKCKDNIQIFNHNRQEVTGTISSISSQKITVEKEKITIGMEPEIKIILACAIPKRSKFETIIEKATELGVDAIMPLETKRTQIKIKPDLVAKKLKRFETVAINASKQSKRLSVPYIFPVTKFKEALKLLTATSIVIMPSLTKNTKPFIDTLTQLDKNQISSITFLIGPEGDFTDEEYALAHQQRCIPVTLGPTVLKVETAALCAISVANLLFK